MSLSLILNILPDDQGYSWTSLECVISQINKIALSLLWSLSILSVEVQGFSQLWLLQCIKGERVVCTYSSLPVIRPAVRGKLFLFLFQLEYPLYHFHICRAKKKMSRITLPCKWLPECALLIGLFALHKNGLFGM